MEKLIYRNMLQVSNIHKRFGGVHAIQGSTFTIEQGKITALIGPNGAGKTTLFNIMTGNIQADEGTVTFQEKDITNKRPDIIANLGISRTFQQVRLFHYLSILDHLRMIKDNDDTSFWKSLIRRSKPDVAAYQKKITDFGIERDVTAHVSDLSYGQRKLLDLMMALDKPHDILMLDEPVAGVNALVQEQIESLLLSLKEKQETMIIIDHDMQFIRRLADHVIVLDAGKVIIEGTPDEVLNDPKVLEAYLGV